MYTDKQVLLIALLAREIREQNNKWKVVIFADSTMAFMLNTELIKLLTIHAKPIFVSYDHFVFQMNSIALNSVIVI